MGHHQMYFSPTYEPDEEDVLLETGWTVQARAAAVAARRARMAAGGLASRKKRGWSSASSGVAASAAARRAAASHGVAASQGDLARQHALASGKSARANQRSLSANTAKAKVGKQPPNPAGFSKKGADRPGETGRSTNARGETEVSMADGSRVTVHDAKTGHATLTRADGTQVVGTWKDPKVAAAKKAATQARVATRRGVQAGNAGRAARAGAKARLLDRRRQAGRRS